MDNIPKNYLLYAAGIPVLILGLIMSAVLTPSPAEPVWYWYFPPTLPGLLIWGGVGLIVIGAVWGRLSDTEPRYIE